MNKKSLVIVVVILLLIGGSIVYLLTSSADKTAKREMIGQMAGSSNTSEPATNQDATTGQSGAYVEYSQSAITDSTGIKLLFFHAEWCPQCRDLESDIKNKGVPSGVTIIKVDYDTNQTLRQKYGVTLQTTVVRVDDQGNLVSKFVAYDDPSISAIKENLL